MLEGTNQKFPYSSYLAGSPHRRRHLAGIAPLKATKIPSADAPREERVARALEMIANTCPFDVTGHPAMTIPCGLSNELPVGMMLVGRKWNDATVLRAAHAFEQISGYKVHPQKTCVAVGQ